MQLTFASYNIHKSVGLDRQRDPERILSVLHELGADVIALQEADRRIGRRLTTLPRQMLAEHHWQVAPVAKRPGSIGWHGNAILVRQGIRILDAEPLELPTLEPRGAARVDLEKDGKTLRVLGMHLDLSGLRRRDQIKAVLSHIEECNGDPPTVIMGDLNEWSTHGGSLRSFEGPWQLLTPGRSFPSRQPRAPLDRIILSEHWEAGDMGVHHSALSSLASDHLPVWAKARILA